MEVNDLTFHITANPRELAVIQMALKEFVPEESFKQSDYHCYAQQLLDHHSCLFDLAWKYWNDAP